MRVVTNGKQENERLLRESKMLYDENHTLIARNDKLNSRNLEVRKQIDRLVERNKKLKATLERELLAAGGDDAMKENGKVYGESNSDDILKRKSKSSNGDESIRNSEHDGAFVRRNVAPLSDFNEVIDNVVLPSSRPRADTTATDDRHSKGRGRRRRLESNELSDTDEIGTPRDSARGTVGGASTAPTAANVRGGSNHRPSRTISTTRGANVEQSWRVATEAVRSRVNDGSSSGGGDDSCGIGDRPTDKLQHERGNEQDVTGGKGVTARSPCRVLVKREVASTDPLRGAGLQETSGAHLSPIAHSVADPTEEWKPLIREAIVGQQLVKEVQPETDRALSGANIDGGGNDGGVGSCNGTVSSAQGGIEAKCAAARLDTSHVSAADRPPLNSSTTASASPTCGQEANFSPHHDEKRVDRALSSSRASPSSELAKPPAVSARKRSRLTLGAAGEILQRDLGDATGSTVGGARMIEITDVREARSSARTSRTTDGCGEDRHATAGSSSMSTSAPGEIRKRRSVGKTVRQLSEQAGRQQQELPRHVLHDDGGGGDSTGDMFNSSSSSNEGRSPLYDPSSRQTYVRERLGQPLDSGNSGGRTPPKRGERERKPNSPSRLRNAVEKVGVQRGGNTGWGQGMIHGEMDGDSGEMTDAAVAPTAKPRDVMYPQLAMAAIGGSPKKRKRLNKGERHQFRHQHHQRPQDEGKQSQQDQLVFRRAGSRSIEVQENRPPLPSFAPRLDGRGGNGEGKNSHGRADFESGAKLQPREKTLLHTPADSFQRGKVSRPPGIRHGARRRDLGDHVSRDVLVHGGNDERGDNAGEEGRSERRRGQRRTRIADQSGSVRSLEGQGSDHLVYEPVKKGATVATSDRGAAVSSLEDRRVDESVVGVDRDGGDGRVTDTARRRSGATEGKSREAVNPYRARVDFVGDGDDVKSRLRQKGEAVDDHEQRTSPHYKYQEVRFSILLF